MASQPVWQPNYVDLGDDRTFRFGAECVVCHARYETPLTRLPTGPDAELDDAPGPEEVQARKRAAFVAFAAAYYELGITCPQCQHVACPECWDADHGLCGACVTGSGLLRSPHRGLPVHGPLADGRLRRTEPGDYSDPGNPPWLQALLQTHGPAPQPLARELIVPEQVVTRGAASVAGPAPALGLASAGAESAPASDGALHAARSAEWRKRQYMPRIPTGRLPAGMPAARTVPARAGWLKRALATLLAVAVLVLVAAIVAAGVSLQVNDALRVWTHVDVRALLEMLAHALARLGALFR